MNLEKESVETNVTQPQADTANSGSNTAVSYDASYHAAVRFVIVSFFTVLTALMLVAVLKLLLASDNPNNWNEGTFHVQAVSWHSSTDIETYQTNEYTGWDVPLGAVVVDTEYDEQNGVITHYTVNEYAVSRRVEHDGTGVNVDIPPCELQDGEREGTTTISYYVQGNMAVANLSAKEMALTCNNSIVYALFQPDKSYAVRYDDKGCVQEVKIDGQWLQVWNPECSIYDK